MSNKNISSELSAIFLIIIICLISCSKSDNKMPELQFTGSINKYDQETYVNNILDIKCYNEDYFVIDTNIGSLFIFDKNFKLKYKIGEKGRGPEEFVGLSSVITTSKYVYLSDYVGNFVDRYDIETYEFKERIKIPKGYHLPLYNFYADDENNFIIMGMEEKAGRIVKYNVQTNVIVPFENYNTKSWSKHMYMVETDNNIMLGVSRYSKDIYVFSLEDCRFIKKLEISFPQNIIGEWNELIKDGKNPPFYTDAYWNNGYLYMSFQDFHSGKRGLVKVKLNQNLEIDLVKFYHFKSKNGDEVICVSNNKIVTYAIGPRSIQQYKFPN